jgi:hypothetical protein
MKNLKSLLISIVVVGSLTACGPTISNKRGEIVTLSETWYQWEELTDDQLQQPMFRFYDKDILSRQTQEDIENNNKALEIE